MKKRDVVKYELKDGNTVLYVGITNDLDRRFKEHSKDKDFKTMQQIGNKTTREAAENWETGRIETYAKNHKGSIPPLNKTKNGK